MAGGTVPMPTPETEPFWAGTLAGELRVQQCESCGRHYFYPRPFCRYCQSRNVTWRTVSGTGRLVSYVINYRPLPPADPAEPQVIALVELDEGPLISSTLVGDRMPRDVYDVGQRVEIAYEDHPREGFTLPRFRIID